MPTPNTTASLGDIDAISLLQESGMTAQEIADAIKKSKNSTRPISTDIEIDNMVIGSKVERIQNDCNILTNLVLSDFDFSAPSNVSTIREYVPEGEYGENVIKITHTADGRCWGKKNISIPNNTFYGKMMSFTQKVKVSSTSLSGSIIFYFKMSDNTEYSFFRYLNNSQRDREGDWLYLTIYSSDLTPVNHSTIFNQSTADITTLYIGTLATKTSCVTYLSDFYYNVKQKPTFSFSFDDGNITDYTIAKKLLDRFNIKATTSIIGSLINQAGFMSESQIRELYDDGWDIACHGLYNHATSLGNYSNILIDVNLNLERIKQFIPIVRTYVYPEGAFKRDSIKVLKEKGFQLACTTEIGVNILSLNNRFYFSRQETSIPTIETLKRYVDDNITNGGHIDFYCHKLTETTLQYHTTVVKYNELIEYIVKKMMNGECNIIRLIDYNTSIK